VIINAQTITSLNKTVRVIFFEALEGFDSLKAKIAMPAPSQSPQNDYSWLGHFPRMREWVGDRVTKALAAHGFVIKNKPFEATIGIRRDDIEDDNFGMYRPMIAELGRAAAEHPDELLAELILNGHEQLCYDGQNFFDTDHPVKIGDEVTVYSNYGGGSGDLWVLLCTIKTLKPFITQTRREPDLIALDDPKTSEAAFRRAEYEYGVDYRGNAGYGLWQLAYASRQPLNADNYTAARVALQSLKSDSGKPLNIKPDTLLVGPSLESAARELLKNERTDAGATNKWYGTAELIVWPLLAE
jgi:phage major head subunit gpT-like protein